MQTETQAKYVLDDSFEDVNFTTLFFKSPENFYDAAECVGCFCDPLSAEKNLADESFKHLAHYVMMPYNGNAFSVAHAGKVARHYVCFTPVSQEQAVFQDSLNVVHNWLTSASFLCANMSFISVW